jgi:rhodanese-related sulfurtransferase
MMSNDRKRPGRRSAIAVLHGIAFVLMMGVLSTGRADDGSWRPTLMAPELLAGLIEEGFDVPYILYVGPGPLFDQGHISGSIYIGPASLNEGIQSLAEAVAELPRNARLVVYCGCCPWDVCPNLAPAQRKLEAMGFTNVKVLDIHTNLSLDWISRGYPTTR